MARFQRAAEDSVEIDIYGVKVETTKSKYKEYNKFLKKNNLPLEKLGAIGGEYTLCITPTSLGNIYVVKHSNGNEIDLTNYGVW